MQIRNADELVRRANYHARFDHIVQGTYGRAKTNGDVQFQGCWIGCLATPHRKGELKDHIEKVGLDSFDLGGNLKGWHYVDEDDDVLTERLYEEFGITEALARHAEIIFENLDYHGEAIEFVPGLAKVLAEIEGIEIDDERLVEHVSAYDDSIHDGTTAEQARDALYKFLRSYKPAEVPA
jgi:hypothetical protein